MAANDAIPATNAKGATDQNTVGTERKSKSPVNLFAFVWGKQKRLQTISAETWFTILTATITPVKIHNHVGICTTGISRIAQQETKQMSATLSSTAPVLLSTRSFRAR